MLVAVDQTFEFFENENIVGFLDIVCLINRINPSITLIQWKLKDNFSFKNKYLADTAEIFKTVKISDRF